MKPHLTWLVVLALGLSGCQQLWEQPSVHPYQEPQLTPTSGTVAVDAPEPLVEPTSGSLSAIQNQKSKIENPLSRTSETLAAGRVAYRRYCWHCHGPKLDGEATVGSSLPGASLSLRTPRVRGLSDGEVFWVISRGSVKKTISRPPSAIRNQPSAVGEKTTTSGTLQSETWLGPEAAVSPPLEGTMTPLERWQVILYLRAVQAGEKDVLTGTGGLETRLQAGMHLPPF
jgi:hypothetical protein